ncbi:MAG: hypothetical protein AAFQ79_12290 [Pseudomonadota bacterium]
MRTYKRGDAPITHIQLYGERNSGTTYLARLLQDNMVTPETFMGLAKSNETPLGTSTFGYKHWFLNWDKLSQPLAAETLFVVIYRNPYTWVKAMLDRPYALERSLDGHGVADLPKVTLAGHINGKDTQNEFDPETGEELTLFQLRQKKIACFERLKEHVDNVAFIPLEDLLANPTAVLKRLAIDFPTAFNRPLNLERAPFSQLTREYESPHIFPPEEQEVLDQHIDWVTEAGAGYRQGDYARNATPETRIFVLHGGSCTGKSSLMRRLVAEGRDIHGIETDDSTYWEDRPHQINRALLQRLVLGASDRDVSDVHFALAPSSPKAWRCAEYLLDILADLGAQRGTAPDVIVATGGALPTPPERGQASLYSWLSDRLNIAFTHVLIDIPEDQHIAQMEARGRAHLKDSILAMTEQKRAQRARFDTAAADYDSLAHRIANRVNRPVVRAVSGEGPRRPFVRLRSGGLQHIQVFGERNSGTKYLSQLVGEAARDPEVVMGSYASLKDPVNKAQFIGYKHYYPQLARIARVQSRTLFLVIYKNPYTWIRSMLDKPYHFKKCLEGKSITDLPNVRLHGVDIFGREIPDVHPHTGERLTLFELRAQKIQQWEALSYNVHNIAFVNYEHLLVSPTDTLQPIIDAFPSLFIDRLAPQYEPDPRYIDKYVTPAPFTDAEMAVMDAHIDWRMEELAGYEQGDLFLPGALPEDGEEAQTGVDAAQDAASCEEAS